MVMIFETSGRFPFRTMRLLGWTLITLGFVLLVLDITDVAYTAANFENDCEDTDHAEWEKSPCDHDDHIYAYIASGVWSSILIIITGIIGARFSKWNIQHLRFQRDLFAVLSILCALLFIPAVIVMHALELKTLKDMGAFYYEDDDLKTRDEAKFALPMVILMIVCLIFIVAAMTAIVSCCCAPVSDYYDNGYNNRGGGIWDSFQKPSPYYASPYNQQGPQAARPSIGMFGPSMYPPPARMDPGPMAMARSMPPRSMPAPVYSLPRPNVAQPYAAGFARPPMAYSY